MQSMVLLLVMFPAFCDAGTLYRCVDVHNRVSYQSRGCAPDARTDRTIEFQAEPDSRPAPVASSAPASRSSQPRIASRGGKKIRRPDPCAAAKAKREQKLTRLGLKRTFNDLSRIDAEVRAVCKGW